MKRKKRMLINIAALILVTVLMVGVFSSAVWNEDDAVHINPDDIENSTLIIGTHLIYIGSLTNTLYDVANTSAGESGQGNVYYKSELAGGTWFDITSASTLADITTGGSPVSNDVIAALFLTHHTKSDGITYDLRTNEAVSIFDIRTPYDLESMEELFPLKMQYDMTLETQSESDYGAMKIAMMTAFFMTPVNNSATAGFDANLAALQRYYDVLAANDGGSAEMDAVQSVMDSIDAARRAEVMNILDGALQNLAKTLQTVADTAGETGEDGEETEGEKGSGSDPALQTAVNDSISNVLDSYLNYSGKMLSAGVTVMSETRYDECLKLISDANANNHADCDADVANIIALDNIQNNVVANKPREIELLEAPLIPAATRRYTDGLGAGQNAEYSAAVAQNAASALLNGIIKSAGNEISVARSELEFFIDALCMRLEAADAIDFVDLRLNMTNGYFNLVPNDAFRVMAEESIDAHIDFLTKLRRSLVLKMGGNEADKLKAEKAELQKELLSALDNNDLAGAKEIEGRISDIDDLLDSMPDTDDSAAEAAEDLGADARDIISNGGDPMEDLLGAIDALGALVDVNAAAAFPVLESLRDDMVKKRDLEGDDSFDDAIAAIEDLMLNNKDAYDRSLLKGISQSDAEDLAEDFFNGGSGGGARLFDDGILGGDGGDVTGLTDFEKNVVFILALKMYNEASGDTSLDGMMRALTNRQIELLNPLVYRAIKDTTSKYLPAPSIAYYMKLRYVWNRNLSEATLARGGTYNYYRVYSNEVVTGRGKTDIRYMTYPARFLDSVHLPDDYTYEEWGLWSVYIPQTDYGVLVSEALESFASELLSRLLRAAAA